MSIHTGSEFQSWDPIDWVENPPFLNGIDNIELRMWAQKLNEAWKFLGRQIKGMGAAFITHSTCLCLISSYHFVRFFVLKSVCFRTLKINI